MRIESIEIKNFRQYREAKFEFKAVSGHKDIHVVIGEGGEGKTNILNALTWALYEEELHLGNSSAAIAMINTQYVEELRNHGEKKGEVSVTVEFSTEDRNKWTLQRTAVFSITASDVLQIDVQGLIVNPSSRGHLVIDNPDDVNAYIQRYVPKEINEYIFFDGEHLDDYFKAEKKQNIENGIKDLTQASIVKKAIDSLDRYVKTEINPLLKNSGDSAVRDAQIKLEDATMKIEQAQDTISEINSQIQSLSDEINAYASVIQGNEGIKEKALRLEELERESEALAKKEHEVMSNLMKFTREYYTLFALYPSMKAFAEYIEVQSKAGNLPPKIDKKLVQSMLDQNWCLICNQPLDAEHRKGIESLLKRLEVSSETSAELNKASSALQAFFDKLAGYQESKNVYLRARNEIKDQIEKNEEEYEKLSSYMHNIPNSEEISDAITKREQCIEQRTKLNQKLGKEQYVLENAIRERDEAQKELEKAMSKNKQLAIYQKQRDFCVSSIQILSETMNEVLSECRTEMQEATFKIFEKLMWKKDIFSEIKILEDYSFLLKDMYGNQTLGSCSAAERALLALSFTLALQDISGHDSLLYIDTPVGRVGTKSRETFMDVLLDISDKKQVILTFTPTEYDETVRTKLAKSYSSYCKLNFNDKDGVTTVVDKSY